MEKSPEQIKQEKIVIEQAQRERIAAWLNEHIKAKKWSVREAARRSGVPNNSLVRARRCEITLSTKSLVALADAFGVPRESALRLIDVLRPPADEMDELDLQILQQAEKMDDEHKELYLNLGKALLERKIQAAAKRQKRGREKQALVL